MSLSAWLRSLLAKARLWLINPAPAPSMIGKGSRYHRPVPIEVGFVLHADGKVYQKRRNGQDERVSDEHLIGVVHREYADLVAEYRRRHP